MSDTPPAVNHDLAVPGAGTLSLVKQAARDGAADAREAATRTWAATSLFMSRFVYTTCYTLSYGMVFPALLVAQAIPRNNPAVQGLIDGAHAAKHQVEQIRGTAIEPRSGASTPTIAPA
jgi:hypothetical protein